MPQQSDETKDVQNSAEPKPGKKLTKSTGKSSATTKPRIVETTEQHKGWAYQLLGTKMPRRSKAADEGKVKKPPGGTPGMNDGETQP